MDGWTNMVTAMIPVGSSLKGKKDVKQLCTQRFAYIVLEVLFSSISLVSSGHSSSESSSEIPFSAAVLR